MRLFSRVCFASAMLAAVFASAAFAQPPERGRDGDRGGPGGFDGRRGGGPPPPEVMMRMMPVLAALDADHDGKISKAEIENATAALKTLDKNSDGQLTHEELRPDFAAMGARGGPPGEGRPGEGRPGGGDGRPGGGNPNEMVDRFMQSDKNKDGKLSKDEVPERMQGLITRADADNDGVATREELQAMASRGMGRGEEGRGPEGRGPDGPRGPEGFARMFESQDANKDGKLSSEEMPEQMKARLEQFDTDKDGSVSREEMKAMMSRMRERGDGAGRGGPEGGGRPGGDRPQRPEAE